MSGMGPSIQASAVDVDSWEGAHDMLSFMAEGLCAGATWVWTHTFSNSHVLCPPTALLYFRIPLLPFAFPDPSKSKSSQSAHFIYCNYKLCSCSQPSWCTPSTLRKVSYILECQWNECCELLSSLDMVVVIKTWWMSAIRCPLFLLVSAVLHILLMVPCIAFDNTIAHRVSCNAILGYIRQSCMDVEQGSFDPIKQVWLFIPQLQLIHHCDTFSFWSV